MSFNKRKYMTTLSTACIKLDIPRHAVTIVHGGACVIHGLKETTNDIDVYLLPEYWNSLLTLGYVKHELPSCGTIPAAQLITAHGIDWFLHTPDREFLTYNYRGYRLTNQLQLLKDSIALGRTKDIPVIQMLSHRKHLLTPNEHMRMLILVV